MTLRGLGFAQQTALQCCASSTADTLDPLVTPCDPNCLDTSGINPNVALSEQMYKLQSQQLTNAAAAQQQASASHMLLYAVIGVGALVLLMGMGGRR